MNDTNERLEDFAEDKAKARFWFDQIEQSSKHEAVWRERAEEIVKRYRDEEKRAGEWRYAMLWANTQLNMAALVGQIPAADVSRRWVTDDRVVRDGAEIMEKAIKSAVDDRAQERSIRNSVLEACLPGRGVIRVRYNAEFEEVEEVEEVEELEQPELSDFMGSESSAEPSTEERKKSERVYFERVYWQDYRESPSRSQEDVWWRAFRDTTLDRDGLIEKYGEALGKKIPTPIKGTTGDATAQGDSDNKKNVPAAFGRADIWEIWNKRDRKIITIAKGYDRPVKEEDPPIQFEGFFDCASPLVLYRTTDNGIPLPEYGFYQDLALELDVIQGRLAKMVSVMKIGGFYHALLKNFPSLEHLTDGQFLPTDEKAMFALGDGNPGLDRLIASLPIERWASVIPILTQRVEMLKAAIFEITGFSDLLRGQTTASETLGAQNLKAQFGSFRLLPKQREVQAWLEETYSLAGEVIAEMFDADTLTKITGIGEVKPIPPFEPPELPDDMDPREQKIILAQAAMQWEQQQQAQQDAEQNHYDKVIQFLRDQQMRTYRANVELDELARPDRSAMQEQQSAFMTGASQFIQSFRDVPKELMPPMLAAFKQWARNFKMGKEVEELLDKAIEGIVPMIEQREMAQAEAAGQPTPDAQLKSETDIKIAELRAQLDAHKAEMQLALKHATGNQQAPEGEQDDVSMETLVKINADMENKARKEEGDTKRVRMKEDGAMARELVKAGVTQRGQEIGQETAIAGKMADVGSALARDVLRPVNGDGR